MLIKTKHNETIDFMNGVNALAVSLLQVSNHPQHQVELPKLTGITRTPHLADFSIIANSFILRFTHHKHSR